MCDIIKPCEIYIENINIFKEENMSSVDVAVPKNVKSFPDPQGQPTYIPELEFPRKLEMCQVQIWSGADYIGTWTAPSCDIWLLAPNVIRTDDGEKIIERYNVSIVVKYLNYSKKE